MKLEFKTEPMQHQREVLRQMYGRKYFALFWEQGTGKTKTILDEIWFLFCQGKVEEVLIIAPKGVYLNWVREEIPKHTSFNQDNSIIFTTKSTQNAKYEAQLYSFLSSIRKDEKILKIMITNIDTLSHCKSKNYLSVKYFAEKARKLYCVIDESHTIKNTKSIRTKAALKLGLNSLYNRIASGTPITNSLLDVFAQCQFLSSREALLGHNSIFTFRKEFCNIIERKTNTGAKFSIITGFKNEDRLQARLQLFASVVKKVDCLDLPPKVYSTLYIELTAEQKKYYNIIARESLIELTADLQKGVSEQLVISNALTRMGKLHQVTCGHIIDAAKNVISLENNREEALIDFFEVDLQRKIVIFRHFKHDEEIIKAACDKCYEQGYVIYTGNPEDIKSFREDDSKKVFIASLHTGSEGITLTNASTMLFFSNNFSLKSRLQAEDRIHRKGQLEKCTYTDLVTDTPIELKILQALKDKKNIADSIIKSDLHKIFQEVV
jgi:SNF2 family DNA or RNA helicase